MGVQLANERYRQKQAETQRKQQLKTQEKLRKQEEKQIKKLIKNYSLSKDHFPLCGKALGIATRIIRLEDYRMNLDKWDALAIVLKQRALASKCHAKFTALKVVNTNMTEALDLLKPLM